MATIAEQLISGAQASVGKQNIGADVAQGVALAQNVDNLKANRQKLEASKVELNLKQNDAIFKSLARVSAAKTPAERKFHQNQATQRFQAAQPNGNPEVLNQLFADDELRRRSIVSFNQLRAGETGKSAAFQQELSQRFAGDPEGFENAVNELAAQASVQETAETRAGVRESEFTRTQALRREAIAGQQVVQQQRVEAALGKETRAAGARLDKEQRAAKLKLSDRLIKLQITDSVNTLKRLDQLIPGGLDAFTGENIPGIGATGNLPGAVISAEGRQIRSVSAELRNAILKARSGGAVTPSEAARLLEELGLSEVGILPQFKTDQEFVNGLKRYRAKLKDVLAGVESGFDKDVVSAFSGEFQQKTGSLLSSSDPFLAGKQEEAALEAKALVSGLTQEAFDSFDEAKKERLRLRVSQSAGREVTLDEIKAEIEGRVK